jgi:cell wall assembly regulator SMI1
MNPELKLEIERLKQILKNAEVDFELPAGATDEEIAFLEETTKIKLDEDLKEFYRFANGSNYNTVFAVFSDQPTPCAFEPIDGAIKWRQQFYNQPEEFDPVEEERDYGWKPDERIQPFWRHPRWLAFAQFNGFSTSIMLDTFPTEKGKHGQIIVYQHDPDAIYYVANSFLEFLKMSNNLLEKEASEFFF